MRFQQYFRNYSSKRKRKEKHCKLFPLILGKKSTSVNSTETCLLKLMRHKDIIRTYKDKAAYYGHKSLTRRCEYQVKAARAYL